MSVYKFLRQLKSQPEQPVDEEPSFRLAILDNFIEVCLLWIVLIVALYFVFFRNRTPRQNFLVLNFIFNFQNYFNRPIINDVHFHQNDQVVPDS